jgi:hypothetical protein
MYPCGPVPPQSMITPKMINPIQPRILIVLRMDSTIYSKYFDPKFGLFQLTFSIPTNSKDLDNEEKSHEYRNPNSDVTMLMLVDQNLIVRPAAVISKGRITSQPMA